MLKKTIALFGLCLLLPMGMRAQDIYTLENFSKEDLNGTARYVGMGGAMSALGGDLSVMSSNPAGIALYRSSDVAATLSFNTLEDAEKFDGKGKSHLSFDQIGLVYAINVGDNTCRFLNLGFNYHKQKNFNQLLNAGFRPNNYASQTWQMAYLSEYWGEPKKATPLANMGWETYLLGVDDNNQYSAFGASSAAYQKAQWGGIQSYDFNISTNLSEQFYLGLTIGAINVDYNSYALYRENLIYDDLVDAGKYSLSNNLDLSGNGFNVKFGFIARPIASSAFRVGASFSSPTYYNLKMKSYSRLVANYSDDNSQYDHYTEVGGYEYNIHTPWKFNFSLGHILAKCIAIGAEYEYSDYSTAKVTYDDGYDYMGWGFDETDDHDLNAQAGRHLKGVSTYKLGLEWMLDPNFSLRCGYNYVSSPFKKGAYANQFINSASLDYTTTTDYMNLSGINRFTVGLGLKFGSFYADAACQYQHQSGHFYPFNLQYGEDGAINDGPSSKLNLSRTQVMFTFGYRF